MALGITKATFGVDENGIQALINDLNTKCITDTKTKMSQGMDGLRDAVNASWQGKSAENFKHNLDSDRKTISEGLEKSFEILKKELFEIANKMGEVDESLIKKR